MGIDRRLRDPCYHLAATHFYAMACVIGDDLWSSDLLTPSSSMLSLRGVLLMIALLLLADQGISLLIEPFNHSSFYMLVGETLRYPVLILLFVLLARRGLKAPIVSSTY